MELKNLEGQQIQKHLMYLKLNGMAAMTKLSQSHSIPEFKKIKGYGYRDKNVFYETKDYQDFLFLIIVRQYSICKYMCNNFYL